MHASPHTPLQCFVRCGMHVSRGTVTRGACDLALLGYCLFARANAVSARTQSFVTTAETAIDCQLAELGPAKKRMGCLKGTSQLAKFCFRLRSCWTLGHSKVQVYERYVDGRYGGLTLSKAVRSVPKQ